MKNELNALIMEAMKNHDSVRTESLRAIKGAFLNWQTSKENAGKELTEADEIQLIKKMVKQRAESVEQYIAAGRKELADAEQAQIDVLEEFLPKAATDLDVTIHSFAYCRICKKAVLLQPITNSNFYAYEQRTISPVAARAADIRF
ncbi:MAG: GatB/YqeY domain-containing protein, partial [Paludibacteraceae bacterium]|nr:GatB/YqeY domain-containing protein [Paludibacteraceae bacterium]